jgi:hypothetical protein
MTKSVNVFFQQYSEGIDTYFGKFVLEPKTDVNYFFKVHLYKNSPQGIAFNYIFYHTTENYYTSHPLNPLHANIGQYYTERLEWLPADMVYCFRAIFDIPPVTMTTNWSEFMLK